MILLKKNYDGYKCGKKCFLLETWLMLRNQLRQS